MPRRWPTLVALALIAASGACSGGGSVSSACAAPVNERLDPASVIHVFPGAPEPRYLSDPPTSGPHQLGAPTVGVVTGPIPRPRQVAMLESGYVIVQYAGLAAAQVRSLGGLAGSLVTVAPAAGALSHPVVATAWTWKLACGSAGPPALVAIRSFIAAHKGVGFSS